MERAATGGTDDTTRNGASGPPVMAEPGLAGYVHGGAGMTPFAADPMPSLSTPMPTLAHRWREAELAPWPRAVESLSQLLAAMRMAAILASIDGEVAYLNHAAREALSADCGLVLRGGRIAAASSDTRRRLTAALAGACRAPHVDGALLLGPRRGGAAARPLRVLSMARLTGSGAEAQDGFALLCLGGTRTRRPDASLFAQLFGLTPTEAALMAGIAGGRRLHECAEGRGVSLATVRAQLRNVFVKTGAATQADLTFIAWSVPGLWID